MKNKKLLYGIICGAVALVLIIMIVAINIISVNAPKNPYGFKSEFVDGTSENYQLNKFPGAAEVMVAFEKSLLDSGLKIEKVEFNGYAVSCYYYLDQTDIAQDYVVLDMDPDKENDGYKFYSIETKIFDNTKLDATKNAIGTFLEIEEEEKTLVSQLEPEKDIQTMEYYISYFNREEEIYPTTSNGIISEDQSTHTKAQKVPYSLIEVYAHPAENERKTNLYAIKREERKPKADGQNIDEYGLSFYIPSAMKANSYNGALYVWDFYTGEPVGYSVEGVEVSLKISGLGDKDIDTYVRNNSRPAKSTGVTPFETKEINGKTWYTCNNGTIYYYAAEFLGNVYEIEVSNGKVIDGVNLEDTLKMLDDTLFFE